MRRPAAPGRAAMMAIACAVAVALVSASPAPRPFKSDLTTVDIERAIKIGRSPDSEASQRFHDAYVIPIGDPVLDRLEIVTEFRRVVLRTADKARLADIDWGPRQAAEMLRPWRARIALVLHVTFSPRNVYYTMPRFGIVLYPRPQPQAQGPIEPIDLLATPRYVSGQPAPPGTPILGGLIEATFDASALDHQGVYLAGIALEGREVRRVELDFGRVD